ncbi:hypothetical protein BC827DRAFT_919207 [Russula dissimulans]|nr:hypothetical protein BC827DRAFT_919207 [Russula dissimulans]
MPITVQRLRMEGWFLDSPQREVSEHRPVRERFGTPSIVSAVASIDSNFVRFPAIPRLQRSTLFHIVDTVTSMPTGIIVRRLTMVARPPTLRPTRLTAFLRWLC